MTFISHSPPYLLGACAIPRTGQFCRVQPHLGFTSGFQGDFVALLHVIGSSSRHRIRSILPPWSLAAIFSIPRNPCAVLQCP
jgi:hypothetical protein